MVPCCGLLIVSILASSLLIVNLNLLACMFILFFKHIDMYIFDFTDCKWFSSSCIYQEKDSLLYTCKTKHIMGLHTIQNVLSSSCFYF